MWRYGSAVYAVAMNSSERLSVCLSVTSHSSTKMAKRWIYAGLHHFCKFYKITDNILVMVKDRDIIAVED